MSKSYELVAKEVKRGDMIEVKRSNYSHWILCESVQSDGTVWGFHVSSAKGYSSSSFSGRPNEDIVIKYQKLEDILNDTEDGKPSLCRINNQKETARIKLNGRKSPDMDQVFKELHQNKGSKVEYDLNTLNCEHYCTEWKYGIGWSSQVEDINEAVNWALIGSTCAIAALSATIIAYSLRKHN